MITNFDKESFHSAISGDSSDLACAILGPNLLDRRLSKLVDMRLSLKYCPVTFNERIKELSLHRVIDSDVASDLHTIRKIRNKFAHEIDYRLSFDSRFQQDCDSLNVSKALIDGHKNACGLPDNNLSDRIIEEYISMLLPARIRFEQSVWFISSYLEEIVVSPNSFDDEGIISQVRALGERSGKVNIRAIGSVGQDI